MHPNGIRVDDLIEVHADDLYFEAEVRDKQPKVVTIMPGNPIVYARRHVTYDQIVRVISRPDPEEMAA